MILGAHESATGGPYKSVARAILDGCECMQIFTKNNNRWAQRMWTSKEAELFIDAYKRSSLMGVVSHAAYLINLCSPKVDVREKSIAALEDELLRCQLLQIPYLVLHPGAPGELGEEWGIEEIARNINALYKENGELWEDVTLLLENTAGQGSNLGFRFEQLKAIFSLLDDVERFGVCFDTCHVFAAGYSFTSEESYHEVFDTFDSMIGLERLKVFHLNDSKKGCGSRVDRHEDIGAGYLGLEPFRLLVNDPRFEHHLGILETPFAEGDKPNFANLSRLKELRNELSRAPI